MIRYVCHRLRERSTRLAMLGTLITGAGAIAGALPSPWCFILLAISTAHALMPDGSAKETEHLLASPKNAGRLRASVRKLDRNPPT